MLMKYTTVVTPSSKIILLDRGVGSGGGQVALPQFFRGGQIMCGPQLFKAIQVFQFKLRSHMYKCLRAWTVHMTDKIWFLRRGGSEVADRSIDCSYWPVASPIFTLNLPYKFAQPFALSKQTFSKSKIRLRTFRLSFLRLYNDDNWPLGFLPLDQAVRHTHTEIGTSSPLPHFYCRSNACDIRDSTFRLDFTHRQTKI